MAAVPFCHGVLDSRLRGNDGGGGRIARMGGMAHRRFVALVVWAGGCAELSEPGWAGLKDGQDAPRPIVAGFWVPASAGMTVVFFGIYG